MASYSPHQYSPHEFDPFAPDPQRFQDADATATVAAAGVREAPAQLQSYPHSGSPMVAPRSNNPFNPFFRSASASPQSAYQGAPTPSPISPWRPMMASPRVAPLERQRSLGDYFAIEEVPRTIYTDQEFADIARLLKDTDREPWSRIPRIYTVLRLIGQVPAIDTFLDLGMNDLWLPFHVSQLPRSMPTFHRERFIQSQTMVLTKAVDLENGTLKKHTHFRQGEPFPFDVGDKLGEGGYASVDKVYSSLSGRTYARKRFRRTRAKPSEVQSFMNELQVLKRINHQHCVELVASYTDSKYFGLLISPVADYNLSAFYGVVAGNKENEKSLRSFFGCLAHSLHFLHQNKIRHRDIKPENILVKGSAVYLADFGISLDWENLSRSTTTEDSGKSWTYCAPEVANYEKRNSSSDIWSLGCVFLEMLTVLKGFTVHDLREVFRKHSGRPRFYENIDVAMGWTEQLKGYGVESDNEAVRWIREMVVVDPERRATAETLSVSIATFGRKIKNKKEENSYCGDCCSHDHEMESSSEAASDDDVWARDFYAEDSTPATSPPGTDPSKVQVPIQQDLVVQAGLQEPPHSNAVIHLESSQLADPVTDEDSTADYYRQYRHVQQVPNANPKEANPDPKAVLDVGSRSPEKSQPDGPVAQSPVARPGKTKWESRQQDETPDIEKLQVSDSNTIESSRPDTNHGPHKTLGAADPKHTEEFFAAAEAAAAAMEKDMESGLVTEEDAPSNQSTAKLVTQQTREQKESELDLVTSKALLEHRITVRRQLLEEVTRDITPWRFLDFKGRLPAISSESWHTPADFLASVQSDVVFMEYLRSSDMPHFENFRVADVNDNNDDLAAMMYLLLLNGLDANNASFIENTADYRGCMPLMWTLHPDWSSLPCRNSIAKLLIGFGADVDAKLDDGRNPLTRTSGEGNVEIMKILLDLGCRPDTIHTIGVHATFFAATNGQTDALRILLDHGVPMKTIDFENNQCMTPLAAAAAQGHVEVVKILLARGANHRRGLFTSPLLNATKNGHEAVVRYLLGNGFYDGGAIDEYHLGQFKFMTALHIAALFGHHNVANLLLDKGANHRLMDRDGFTPLHIAAGKGHHLVVEVLINHGASFRVTTGGGFTPSIDAASNGHLKVLQVLCENGMGADEGKSFMTGDWRPIHCAAIAGHPEVVRYLISKGADPTRRIVGGFFGSGMIQGATPLNLAKKGGHKDIYMILQKAIKERKKGK